MTRYTAVPSKTFKQGLRRLSQDDQKLVLRKVALLESNPGHPSLRTKLLRKKPKRYESSVNMDIRLVWRYKGNKTISITDVGHHDILKKY